MAEPSMHGEPYRRAARPLRVFVLLAMLGILAIVAAVAYARGTAVGYEEGVQEVEVDQATILAGRENNCQTAALIRLMAEIPQVLEVYPDLGPILHDLPEACDEVELPEVLLIVLEDETPLTPSS
jgi:cytochrome c-type biogenesis protein CcmH/NrfG